MNLPTPTPEQLDRSAQLCLKILQKIQAAPNNIISFADYMELALYTPDLGYYMAEHAVFGHAGDFITAPELSPLFAECIARPCLQTLETTGGDILEIGAGTGKLATDLITALPELPEHYYIYEISPALRKRQQLYIQKQTPHLYERFVWLTKLPDKFSGFIIANEVLDALPAECFQIGENEIYNRGVSVKDNQFIWSLYPAEVELKQRIQQLQKELPQSLYPGYFSEIQLNVPDWIEDISKILQKGLVLLFDYGFLQREYYLPERNQGTLMCHYRQFAHPNPFWYPGLQDITVHVDFDAVGNSAVQNNLEVCGFANQAQFLMDCGLIEILERDPELTFANKHAVQILTSPAEMGELFKVMQLGRW